MVRRRLGTIALLSSGVMTTGVAVFVLLGSAVGAAYGSTADQARTVTCSDSGTGRWVTVNADHVNVRAGWGTSYPVVGRKSRGDHLCVMAGHAGDRNPAEHWWAFDQHGKDGWIIDKYVTYGWR